MWGIFSGEKLKTLGLTSGLPKLGTVILPNTLNHKHLNIFKRYSMNKTFFVKLTKAILHSPNALLTSRTLTV
jgi:hypothetical protein